MTKTAKNVWTFLIAGTVAILIPIGVVLLLQKTLAKTVTDDNASVMFAEFGPALHSGNIVHDPLTAAALAREAYQKKSGGILVDGWANPMHVYAILNGRTCELHLQSSGPDGRFGDADDLNYQQTFDLGGGSPTTESTTH
jgi:hypothetical protein